MVSNHYLRSTDTHNPLSTSPQSCTNKRISRHTLVHLHVLYRHTYIQKMPYAFSFLLCLSLPPLRLITFLFNAFQEWEDYFSLLPRAGCYYTCLPWIEAGCPPQGVTNTLSKSCSLKIGHPRCSFTSVLISIHLSKKIQIPFS